MYACNNYRSQDMQHMSESAFHGLCLIVGTSQQVAIRRETADVEELLTIKTKPINRLYDMNIILSGSRREGFRFKGSDVDIMVWRNELRVITDVAQSKYYDPSKAGVLLSDISKSPPGFTLLQLGIQPISIDIDLRPVFVKMNDSLYVSSNGFKSFISLFVKPFFHFINHGPCTASFKYGIGIDRAFCFVCDFWPPSASSWIERCQSWPNSEVVNDVIRGGCHFVAIGHPLGQHEDIEWRISFSQAKQKCVY